MNRLTEIIQRIINEEFDLNNVITLYHGTCENNGNHLIKNGWSPKVGMYGGNMGNSSYLYLSSEPDDALWFAEEKGCNTIIMLKDVPLSHLRPDPEDEAGFTMDDLLNRIKNSKYPTPSKFILTKPLDSSYFTLY